MNLPKTKIAFILLLFTIFIVYKIFRTEKTINYFAKKYELEFNETRKQKGIFQYNSSWKSSYAKKDDILEITYLDSDSLTNFHTKKMLNVKSVLFFWSPKLEEEFDFYKNTIDSSKQIFLNVIYSHQLKNGEDPWGLSYYSIIENKQIIKNKQVSKVQIDSILNSWRK